METGIDLCPLCGTELSRIKIREIEAKLREQERSRAAEIKQSEQTLRERLEKQFKLDIENQKRTAEKKAKEEAQQEMTKVVAERDAAARNLQIVQQRAAASEKERQTAEKKVREEAQRQVALVAAERDLAVKKMNAAQVNGAELVKKALQDAEKERQKELANQRQILEAASKVAILKEQSGFARERESYQKQMQLLEKKLQKKTASELGDGAEIDLLESLREHFQGDRITRVPKGQAGVDIVHEVLYKGEPCGKIVIDSKNHQRWLGEFVAKLRHDQMEAKAEYAILATSVFPAGKKEIFIESDVIVVAPGRAVYVIQILRNSLIAMHIKGLSLKERSTKMARLYKLITSESYAQKFAEAARLTEEILELDVKEQREHATTWKRRGTLAKRVQNALREVETEVSAVIESTGDEEAISTAVGKSASSSSNIVASQESVAWNRH